MEGIASIMRESSEAVKNKYPIPVIQKVPRQVDSNQKCYVPSVVSIGPYHHGKEDLAAVEKLKPKIAREFANRHVKTVSDMSSKFGDIYCAARSYYAEGSTDEWDDDDFAKMMFLDGCFILHVIEGNANGNMKMKPDLLAYVQRDLFLLENQLPFSVLDALMSFMTFKEQDGGIKMVNVFVEQTRALPPGEHTLKRNDFQENASPLHLLDLLHRQLVSKSDIFQLSNPSNYYSYRSVNELKTTRIHFKASQTSRMTDVKYEPGFISGNLRLPPIAVNHSTKSILLNLMAYESCPDTPHHSTVAAYICFMDSLIKSADDVREMISKRIVLNFLSDDHQVVELFHDLARDLVPNPLIYNSIKGQIEEYHKTWWMVWMRKWIYVHFRTPWSLLAFIVSIATLIQTYFSAFPSKW